MVNGWVMKPKTIKNGKTMIRPKQNDETIQLSQKRR